MSPEAQYFCHFSRVTLFLASVELQDLILDFQSKALHLPYEVQLVRSIRAKSISLMSEQS